MEKKRDVYQTVTDRMIELLEAGTPPWIKPWKNLGHSADPHNAVSKRPYSGINTVILWADQMTNNWPTAGFLTFKQAKEAGGTVRKGERGNLITFFKPMVKTEKNEAGEEETSSYAILKAYYVFNVAQCDNLPDKLVAPRVMPEPISDPAFDAWVAATGAQVRLGGSRACYSPTLDEIRFPERYAFRTPEAYACTMLHELGHWTGHKSRLDRDLSKGRFGNPEYAAEELVAELTSAFMAAELGINSDEDQTAAYLASWLKALKDDKRFIFKASAEAQKAANFLKDIASVPKVLEHLEAA